MLIKGGLTLFGGIIVVLVYGGLGILGLSVGKKDEDLVIGGIFLAMAVLVGLIILAFAAVELMAGWRMLKEKPSGRTFGIIASIISLINIPLGTALGIYGLWFLFGEEGKRFYSGGAGINQFPPPPPANWQ